SFTGKEHTSSMWTVTWTAQDNTWHVICGDPDHTNNGCRLFPDDQGIATGTHGYQNNTVDPTTGIQYWVGRSIPTNPFLVDKRAPTDTAFTNVFKNGQWSYGLFPTSVWWNGQVDNDSYGSIFVYNSENNNNGELYWYHPNTGTFNGPLYVLGAGA